MKCLATDDSFPQVAGRRAPGAHDGAHQAADREGGGHDGRHGPQGQLRPDRDSD